MSLFRSRDNASKEDTVKESPVKDNAGQPRDNAGKEPGVAVVSVNPSIVELRKTIAAGTDQYEYALLDGITSLLEKLDAVIDAGRENAYPGANRNHEIIADALRVMRDAGSKMKIAQTEGARKAYEVLKDFNAKKEIYVEDMKRLGLSFAQVQVTDATLGLWKDLADWLQELHDHTANARKDFKKDNEGFVLKKDDGTYPHTCLPDKIFKSSTGGVSKYTLIYNYGVAAKLLRNVITNYENDVKAKLESEGSVSSPRL